jgi:CDP-diacylglycerol--serine O-phosphatidyltransferase
MKIRQAILTAFTSGILILGACAVLLSTDGRFILAAQFIILAAILDGFDGTLARALRAESDFGERLDTYADCVSFGVAPAVMTYTLMWRDYGIWGMAAALAIIVSGVVRFSRGCSFPSCRYRHLFRGLPIPVSATWIGVYVLMVEQNLLDWPGVAIDHGVLTVAFWVPAFAFLFLQVSNVRYLKPSRRQLATALAATVALILVLGHPTLGFCLGTAGSVLAYVIGGLIRHKELVDPEPVAGEAPRHV